MINSPDQVKCGTRNVKVKLTTTKTMSTEKEYLMTGKWNGLLRFKKKGCKEKCDNYRCASVINSMSNGNFFKNISRDRI